MSRVYIIIDVSVSSTSCSSVMTHSSVPPQVREQLQITDNLVRLSVGLESIDDLLGDLSKALNMTASLKEKRTRELKNSSSQ